LEISVEKIKELRNQSGAGVMDCRNVLIETQGNIERALDILKAKSLAGADKRSDKLTAQGIVDSYIHAGGRIGAMVEVNCETDFVARTEEFKYLTHAIALQVAAMNPKYIAKENIPAGSDEVPEQVCLLEQPFIKDQGCTIRDLISQTIAKTGENIKVSRFSRFELGTA
jgi:elongation factor Ts